MNIEQAQVLEHEAFEGGYRRLKLHAPLIGPQVRPGQFLHFKVPHMEQAVLRRPFSIFKADSETVSILYKAVGAGTRTMSFMQVGETASIIGPLGNPFPEAGRDKYPVLVAGGYGMAALYLAAARLRERPGIAFFGGRTDQDILCVKEFEELGWRVDVTTQDGSLGMKGIVTDAIAAWLAERDDTTEPEYFCCGPTGMLKAIGTKALQDGETAWVSLDENMGCGVGACLTCVIRVKDGEDWKWSRTCKEGPVYNAEDVLWEELG